MSVAELLEGKRVCVCGGFRRRRQDDDLGGDRAWAWRPAGPKVAVVTIDPAKRLANALGLEELANEPRRVAPERISAEGLKIEGELWAMMLDPKRTFDELIERIAPDPERGPRRSRPIASTASSRPRSRDRRSSPRSRSSTTSNSEGEFDLLVLDTPPSRNALDFLDAPGRLTSFLEGRALKAFLRPTGIGMRVLGRGASPFLAALRRVTGVDLIGDLWTFFQLLGGMTEDFSARAKQVEQMLHAADDGLRARELGPDRADRGGDLVPADAHRERAAVRRRDRQPRPPRHAG